MRTNLTLTALLMLSVVGCSRDRSEVNVPLVGAWRGGMQFSTGAFAATKDLELMYVFNAGGTMTESSNYDGSPPVPPAYGVWRSTGERKYEAKYTYYWTRPPTTFDEIAKGSGWAPGGYGVLLQQITLSADGKSFESTVRSQVFDMTGKPTEKESIATATASRVTF